MSKQLEVIYKGGGFFPLTPLQGIVEGDKVRISLLKIINPSEDETDEEPGALERAIAKMMNRTPEEIEATRTRLFQQSRPPREIPEGKTLEDMICGKWPGDETDEQILEALEKLS
jgi:predicted DNA-binding antitoxin AbrB/MazE fold protein